MGDEVQKTAVPRSCPDRTDHQGTEDDDEHDAKVRRKSKAERVVEAQALEGVATEETGNEFADAAVKAQMVASHRDGQSGTDAGGDRAEPDALPTEHCGTRRLRHP